MFSLLVLAAVSIHTKVVAQSQSQVVRAVVGADGIDQLEPIVHEVAPVLRVSRRLEEEIELESDDDDEEQGAAFDAQFSDLLQPLHNHHEFQDLLTGLHSEHWADGCRNVFLDVGASRGTNIRMLFEPERYGNASVLPILEQYFGPASMRTRPSSESGLCAFGFEANPRFAEEHRNIEIAYAERGWKVQFFTPVVVSDHDGAEDFYIEDSPATNDLGSSILEPSVANSSKSGKYHKQELPSARFAELVRTKVAERLLSDDDAPGKVFMKMDIVGAEFSVLPDLLKAGVLCQQGGIDGMVVMEYTQIFNNAHKNFTPWSELKEAIKVQNGCQEPSELVEMGPDLVYVDVPLPLPLENTTASEAVETVTV